MVSIDKHSFNSVMAEAAISLNFAVPAKLKDDAKADEEMNISLEIKSLNDFSPDTAHDTNHGAVDALVARLDRRNGYLMDGIIHKGDFRQTMSSWRKLPR